MANAYRNENQDEEYEEQRPCFLCAVFWNPKLNRPRTGTDVAPSLASRRVRNARCLENGSGHEDESEIKGFENGHERGPGGRRRFGRKLLDQRHAAI